MMFKRTIDGAIEEVREELDEEMAEFKGRVLLRLDEYAYLSERLGEIEGKLIAVMKHFNIAALTNNDKYIVVETNRGTIRRE